MLSLHEQGVSFTPFLMGNMQICLVTLLKLMDYQVEIAYCAISPETLIVFIGVMYIL